MAEKLSKRLKDLSNKLNLAVYRSLLKDMVNQAEKLESENEALERAEATLQALEAAGVDNWEGYEDAIENIDD